MNGRKDEEKGRRRPFRPDPFEAVPEKQSEEDDHEKGRETPLEERIGDAEREKSREERRVVRLPAGRQGLEEPGRHPERAAGPDRPGVEVNVGKERRHDEGRDDDGGKRVPEGATERGGRGRPDSASGRDRRQRRKGECRHSCRRDEAARGEGGADRDETEKGHLREAGCAEAPGEGAAPEAARPEVRNRQHPEEEGHRAARRRGAGRAEARRDGKELPEEARLLGGEDRELRRERDEKEAPESGADAPGPGTGQTLFRRRHAFVPPKPNEFDSATFTARSRATFGV